jgi:hypothetical protein
MTEIIPHLEKAFPHVDHTLTEGRWDLAYQSATRSASGGLYALEFESEMEEHSDEGWDEVLDRFRVLRGQMNKIESGGADREDLSEFESGLVYGRPKTWDRSQMEDHNAETD